MCMRVWWWWGGGGVQDQWVLLITRYYSGNVNLTTFTNHSLVGVPFIAASVTHLLPYFSVLWAEYIKAMGITPHHRTFPPRI